MDTLRRQATRRGRHVASRDLRQATTAPRAERSGGAPEPVAIPVVVWLLTAAFGAWLVVTGVLVPVYTSPDEAAHVDMVLALREGLGYPNIGERVASGHIVGSYELFAYTGSRSRVPQGAAAAVPRGQRPTFDEIPEVEPSFVNLLAAHPPLYYAVLSGALTAVAGFIPDGAVPWSADVVVGFLRLVGGVALLMWLPLLAYLAARRLTGDGRIALAAALVPLTVPHVTKLGASVNNDNLLTLACAVLTVHLAAILRGDLSTRRGVLTGVAAGVGLLAKGYALVLPIVVVAVYAVAAWRRRDARALWPGVAAGAVAGVMSGWWWLRNLLRYGSLQPPGKPWAVAPEGFEPSIVAWGDHLGGRLVESSWGWSGLPSDPLSPAASWIAFGVTFVCVVAAFVATRPGDRTATGSQGGARPPARTDLWVMLGILLGILALVVVGTWMVYAYSSRMSGQQGRYVFPGVTGLAVVVAVGAGHLLRRQVRWLPFLTFLGVVVMQGLTTAGVLRDWWGTAGTFQGSLAAALAWAPWPAAVSLASGAVALGLFAVVGVMLFAAAAVPATAPDTALGARAADADRDRSPA